MGIATRPSLLPDRNYHMFSYSIAIVFFFYERSHLQWVGQRSLQCGSMALVVLPGIKQNLRIINQNIYAFDY